MAKSARATTTKNNKQKLKKNVFGPVESARTERLSAKLLELAAQPKPERGTVMEGVEKTNNEPEDQAAGSNAMEIDSTAKGPAKTKKLQTKKRIEKRKSKKSSIVFPKHGERRSRKKR